MKNKTAVIIVAGGNSTRMGGTPKQFILINNKEVIKHTLEKFQNAKLIDEIIVVCREEDEKKIKEIANKSNITKAKAYVYGGKERQDSVMKGVKAISEDVNYIAIHDGARPLITSSLIDEVVKEAYEKKACALGVPVKDTIKIVNKDLVIEKTLNRNSLIAMQTPQVFCKNLYLKAVSKIKDDGNEYTDDCAIVENYGANVYIVKGSYENIKITTPEDVIVAESIIKNA